MPHKRQSAGDACRQYKYKCKLIVRALTLKHWDFNPIGKVAGNERLVDVGTIYLHIYRVGVLISSING